MSNTLLWYTTRGAGAVSLLLLSGVLVLGVLGTARFEAPGWPRFLTTAFHRNLSLMAIAFLALHVMTAVVDPFTSLGWVAAAGCRWSAPITASLTACTTGWLRAGWLPSR